MIQKVPLSILAILQRGWVVRSWIHVQLQQAGNLTSAFQRIKTGLVHPRKNHVGADVAIYGSCGNKKHSTYTHTHMHAFLPAFLCHASYSHSPHQITIFGEKAVITISDQKTRLMKRHTMIFRKPESCLLFACPFESLHHAQHLGCFEMWPLTLMLP